MDPGFESPLFLMIHNYIDLQYWVFPAVGLFILIFNALLLNNVLIRHELSPKNTLLGAFIFIFLMSQSPAASSVNPVLFASIFLIPAFDNILRTFGKADPTQEVFSAAFLLALASLFYFPAILILLVLIFSFIVFSTFSIRQILVALSGVIAVYLYLALFYFLTDQLEGQLAVYSDFFLNLSMVKLPDTYHQYVIWGMHLILFVLSALYISSHMNEWNISVRRKSLLIYWFLLLSAGSIVFDGDNVKIIITIAAIPLTAMVSAYLGAMKKPSLMMEIYMLVMILYSIINNSLSGPC
jgi:hypothetical protein